MAASITVDVAEVSITVRQISVREVYEWQVEVEAKSSGELPGNPAYDLALPECSLDDLARMCDCAADDLAEFAPDDLAPVVAAAQELNPHFFRARAVMAEAVIAHLAMAAAAARETPPAPH